jgi:hypothetical protein
MVQLDTELEIAEAVGRDYPWPGLPEADVSIQASPRLVTAFGR